MSKPTVGLLPLYLELYDISLPETRINLEVFYADIASALEQRGLEVIKSPVCRLKSEFSAAVRSFEDKGADGIATLHLAYSPSLESAEALASTKLPLFVLDTTPTYEFGPDQDPSEIMFNHGIHGVQDMCNLLVRNGKRFQIEAGHWQESGVLNRAAGWARAAKLASMMRSARIGLIGKPFEGMGDFSVPPDVLRSTIGIEVAPSDSEIFRSLLPADNDGSVKEEIASDLQRFTTDGIDSEDHIRSVRTGIAVRRWIEKEKLSGFTVNFLDVDSKCGLPTVPFLEASKAMARGLGYAGEGDVLTAALVGSLASVYTDTTFTEMFCPDWKGDTIFLSHMGEMNVDLADGKAVLMKKPFPWNDISEPVLAVGRFQPGDAVLADLAPGPNNSYNLIVSPVTMLSVEGEDRMKETIHGWFKPRMSAGDYLSAYSRAGGTHHLALVYGKVADEIIWFGEIMGWNTILLDKEKK